MENLRYYQELSKQREERDIRSKATEIIAKIKKRAYDGYDKAT